MGAIGADINAVEIVQKNDGYVVDDFMLELPQGTLPDAIVSACTAIAGVEVLWLSYYPEAWGLHADVDVLDRMTDTPDLRHSQSILVDAAPDVFHVTWALLVDAAGTVSHRTALAPELAAGEAALLGDLTLSTTRDLRSGWLPGWNETLIAVAPFPGGSAIVIGRNGGPEFLKSEIARLKLLASLADGH